jgi:hypothetical protein
MISKYKLKLVACSLIKNKNLYFHHFIKKELSDYPVEAIHMAVSFLYRYVDINLKILKCTVKWRLINSDF